MWYVVQVFAGREEAACSLVRKIVGEDVLEECFVPRYEVERKHHGEWVRRTHTLFPGYLIVRTREVDRLVDQLRRVPAFTKLLGSEEAFIPLERAEIAWMDAFTKEKHRVIGMSMGVMEGDRVVVQEGPLVGREGWIKKIDRRKSLAYLEVSMCGRMVEVKVGLGIVGKHA